LFSLPTPAAAPAAHRPLRSARQAFKVIPPKLDAAIFELPDLIILLERLPKTRGFTLVSEIRWIQIPELEGGVGFASQGNEE